MNVKGEQKKIAEFSMNFVKPKIKKTCDMTMNTSFVGSAVFEMVKSEVSEEQMGPDTVMDQKSLRDSIGTLKTDK